MTLIELVDLGHTRIGAQQIGQGALIEPLPMQPPFAARREQPIDHQYQQHLVPARALATLGQTLSPELILCQLLPELERQPAPAPHPRPTQAQLRQTKPHDRLVHRGFVNAFLGKQRQRTPLFSALVKDLDRLTPRPLLRGIDLA